MLKNLMPVLPNTTYYVTTNNSNYSFVFRSYDKNGNYLGSYGGIGNNGTLTTTTSQSQGIYYLGTIIYRPSGEATETSQHILDLITSGDIKPFICLNSETNKTYEPYYNYELSKIGTYQDRIYKNDDKWYIENNVGKHIFTGSSSEAWTYYNNSLFLFGMNASNFGILASTQVFSQYFTYSSSNANNYTIKSGNSYAIQIRYDEITSASDFKTWLSTHNTEVRYILATPTYTEITNTNLINELNELEKMMSYNGQTNISISGNLPMLVSVSALKGE